MPLAGVTSTNDLPMRISSTKNLVPDLSGDYNGDGVLDAKDIDLQTAEMKKDPADQDLANSCGRSH